MDERVARLVTPDECEQFALNVQTRLPELAKEARRRAVELRAASHGASAAVEPEALEALYAYERVLSGKAGKEVRASRTWQMIKRHGIIEAVERAVNRDHDTVGYRALVEMGMKEFAFEAVVLRHPELFSKEAVARSDSRLKAMAGGANGSSIAGEPAKRRSRAELEETGRLLAEMRRNSVSLPPGCPSTTELLREDRDR